MTAKKPRRLQVNSADLAAFENSTVGKLLRSFAPTEKTKLAGVHFASVRRLAHYLESAVADPIVQKSPITASLAAMVLDEISNSRLWADVSEVKKLREAEIVSRIKSRAASLKNVAAKSWVLSEWASRTNTDEKKTSFADRHSAMLENGVTVQGDAIKAKITPKTIANRWLPKSDVKPTT